MKYGFHPKFFAATPQPATQSIPLDRPIEAEATDKTMGNGAGLAACCFMLAVAAVFCSIAAMPEDDRTVAAVFPPWWSARHAFEAAGSTGQILRTGAIDSVLVVRSAAPLLHARLRAAGALLVISSFGLGGCDPGSTLRPPHE